MPSITEIAPGFAVAAALSRDDFGEIARLGYRTVINNRPDGEEAGVLTSDEAALEARRCGLSYHHVPASPSALFTDDVVAAMADALAKSEGPILAHCRSGLRSAIVWAAASARSLPVDTVLARLAEAGFEASHLRDDLDSQALRSV